MVQQYAYSTGWGGGGGIVVYLHIYGSSAVPIIFVDHHYTESEYC